MRKCLRKMVEILIKNRIFAEALPALHAVFLLRA